MESIALFRSPGHHLWTKWGSHPLFTLGYRISPHWGHICIANDELDQPCSEESHNHHIYHDIILPKIMPNWVCTDRIYSLYRIWPPNPSSRPTQTIKIPTKYCSTWNKCRRMVSSFTVKKWHFIYIVMPPIIGHLIMMGITILDRY